MQKKAEFAPRDRTEIFKRELGYMFLEMDDGQQHHGYGTTGCSGNGCTLNTHLRTAPMSENKGIVTEDVQNIGDARHHHRINHLVCTSQRGRERQRQCLKERQSTRQAKIHQSIPHQFGAQSHQQQEFLCIEEKQCADHHAKHQIRHQCHAHHLHKTFMQSCADILGTKDGCAHREKLIDEKHQRHELVVKTHSRHAIVAVTTQHHGVNGTQQHHQRNLNENWDSQYLQLPLQGVFVHIQFPIISVLFAKVRLYFEITKKKTPTEPMGLICASKTIWSFCHFVILSFFGTKVVRRCPFELYDVRLTRIAT